MPDRSGACSNSREYDVDIDMHLDFGNAPDDLDATLVCELTEQYRLGGQVAIGHATKLDARPGRRRASPTTSPRPASR